MNHIVVIGFMGSGKTRVGKKLAEDLQFEFLDVDKKISKDMKMTISDIFNRFGEPFYRALETKTIKELLENDKRTVVSVGSGLPLQEQNHKYLKQLGHVVYLNASVETLKERLSGDNKRPSLKGQNLEEKITKMLATRAPIYESLADIIVVTGEQPFQSLVKEIEEKLKECEKNS